MEHPWEGGKKVYINGQGHMTKMAAMAINRKKTFKHLLLQKQKANDFETWCEASVTGALQSLYCSVPGQSAILVSMYLMSFYLVCLTDNSRYRRVHNFVS